MSSCIVADVTVLLSSHFGVGISVHINLLSVCGRSILALSLCALSLISVPEEWCYRPAVMFLPMAHTGNSVRLNRGTPHVVMANMTTATPIKFTPNPAFTFKGNRVRQNVSNFFKFHLSDSGVDNNTDNK